MSDNSNVSSCIYTQYILCLQAGASHDMATQGGLQRLSMHTSLPTHPDIDMFTMARGDLYSLL